MSARVFGFTLHAHTERGGQCPRIVGFAFLRGADRKPEIEPETIVSDRKFSQRQADVLVALRKAIPA